MIVNANLRRLTLTAVGCLVLLCSCQGHKDEKLTVAQKTMIAATTFGFYSGDKASEITSFDDRLWQVAFNPTKLSTRIQKDNMSAYMSCTFSEVPKQGSELTITLTAKGITVPEGRRTVKVLKMADDKIWIWETLRPCGFILCYPVD